MPLPTVRDVHVNVPLTNIAEKWLVGDEQFVAQRVFPMVPTNQMSGLIVRYCRKDFFNLHDVRPRAPGAKSQGVGFHVNTDTHFLCRNYATRYELPDEVRAEATAPIQPERTGVQIITQRLKLKLEYLFAQAAFVPGVWTNQVAVPIAWNNANATPIVDVDTQRILMHLTTGFQPNTLLVNKQVFRFLRTHPTITAIYRNLTAAEPRLNVQQVAAALDIERLIVAEAVYDEGPMQGQWDGRWCYGNHALLCYTTPTPSIEQPSSGYMFSYTGANFTGTNIAISQYRGEEDSRKDIFVGDIHFDTQIVEPDLGVFFPNVIAGVGIVNQSVVNIPICR
ncbi:MAG TPA: hypothetical protein VNA25_30520 [Phycisphaerae bacterium]|nr:hypothetical protein [Phycisphaerae bacterium]